MKRVSNSCPIRTNETLSPPSSKRQALEQSSSTCCQSSKTTSNLPSNNSSFNSYRDKTTSINLQHDEDTDSTLSLSRDTSDNSCFKIPNLIQTHTSSNKRTPRIANKSFCPSKNVFPIAVKDKSLTSTPNKVKPQNDNFDNLPIQNVKNYDTLLIGNESHKKLPNSNSFEYQCTRKDESVNSKSNHLSSDNSDKSMVIFGNETSSDGSEVNVYVDSGDPNINTFEKDVSSEKSQLLMEDPALRKFDILDELMSDHEEGEIMDSNSSKSTDSELEEELPIDDIDKMLDEGLPEKFKTSGSKESVVKVRRKVVLEEIGHDHFDLLPEGWIQITHSSGMPVYLNQKSRVCTMSRPYYLGPGSSRNHNIPLSAIPCLHYRRASELQKKSEEEKEMKKQSQSHQSQSEIELMSAEIETYEENKATQSLEASEVHEYCKQVFKFKTLNLIPFRTWADRRKYVKMKKDVQKKQRPTLPGGTKLLKFPINNPDGSVSKSKEWIINPNGKSYVCILHEYVQHALKKHPKYQFQELENPATPYSATVFIEDLKYGFGMGASKKQAKIEAAKVALEVLIPGMKDKIEPDSQTGKGSGPKNKSNDTDISIFDQIRVEDPRVAEFCAKSTEPPPYAILLTCLNRNAGFGEIEISYKMSSKSFISDEFTMSVGKHTATVCCRNKREGKQRAAQAILQAIHPNITYWGSLLRMYGNRAIKNIKEKKQEEQEITQLQSKASLNQPNFAILNKLKTELLKLKAKQDSVTAKGQFTLPDNIILPSLSSTDLNKVNL